MIKLRDYQEDIITRVFNTQNNIIVGLPTGAGKTVIAGSIIDRYRKEGTKVIFLVPRIDLLQQSIEKFTEMGLQVGIIWKDIDQHGENKDVYVSVRQTMYRKYYASSFMKDKVVIIDEAHIGLEAQRDNYYDQCKRLIGLTATPEQMSGNSMIMNGKGECKYACYDEYLYPYQIKDLQDKGYLAQYKIDTSKTTLIPEEVLRRWKRKGANEVLGQDILNLVVQAVIGLSDEINECTEPTIIFTPTVESAGIVLKALNAEEWAIVTGETPKAEREKYYEQVENGELKGLINCGVLTTGFDLPCIKRLYLFRHILSKSLYIQIIGRALRPFENKTAIIRDVFSSISNFNKHISKDGVIAWFPGGWKRKEKNEDIVPEEYKEQYKNDPYGTLILLMKEYKAAMDDMESALKQYESNICIKPVINGRGRYYPLEMETYLKSDFFEDGRKIIPSIMRERLYTKEQCNNKRITEPILMAIWDKVSTRRAKDVFELEEYKECVTELKDRCEWWFRNFVKR